MAKYDFRPFGIRIGRREPRLPIETVDTDIDPLYDRPADLIATVAGSLQLPLNNVNPGEIVEID